MEPSCKIDGKAGDQEKAQGLEQEVDDLKDAALEQLKMNGQDIAGTEIEENFLHCVKDGEKNSKEQVPF